jgi:hypothetical protein
MFWLRLINLAGWLLVLAYMAPAVVGILRSKPRDGDPPRLIYASRFRNRSRSIGGC